MIEKPKERSLYKAIDFLHEHIIGVIIAVVIIACALSTLYVINDNNEKNNQVKDETQYKTMDTLYFAMSPVKTLNPLTSTDEDVYYISQLLYSSLFKLDDNLGITKDLVSSYKANASRGTVTITLKSGLKFADKTRLTSDDIKFTINKIQEIGSKSPYYAYASKIESVSISSDTKFTVEFSSSKDAAIDNLVFPIVSNNDYSTELNYKPVGSGPYKYSGYDSSSFLKLKANSLYYEEVPKNKIQFKILPDTTSTTGLMTIDAITTYVNTSSDADSDAADKKLGCTQITSNECEYLGFNFKNKYLSDKRVRQAIATAIDTDTLVNDNYGGTAIPADSIYYPGFLGVENKGDAYPINQSSAIKTLNKAGYSDIDEDGILEDSKKKELSLTLIVNSNDRSRVDAANNIASNLGDIGFDITVKKLSWADYKKALKSGKFDLMLGGYKFDKQYDLRELFNKKNVLKYNSNKVLKLVNKMETAISGEEEVETYKSIKSELQDQVPYYCLCYKTYSFVTAKKFNGKQTPVFFDRYRGAVSWTWQRAISDDTASDTYKSSSDDEDSK